MRRGEIFYARLDPTQGSEQAGVRPVLIVQNDILNRASKTVVVVPFTRTMKMAKLPSCVLVPAGEGGLTSDSVALCHQLRALDKSRLTSCLGTLSPARMKRIDDAVRYVLSV